MNTGFVYKYLITTLLGSTLPACPGLNAQTIYAGRYKAIFTHSPERVPTSKVPDAPLAGNGDIGLTLGGNPDQLTFYFGKNDFWRAYPVYPGGGIALPGGLNISINDLKGASYYAEQIIDKAVIMAKFNKGDLEVFLNTWVSATKNNIVVEITSNKVCRLHFNLWAATGNTSVNQSGKRKDVYWVTRSFENTPLLKWPCNIAMAMKIIGSKAEGNEIVLPAGKKIIMALSLYTNQDRTDWKEGTVKEALSLTLPSIESLRKDHEKWWATFWAKSSVRIADTLLEKYYYGSQYLFACSSREGKFAPGIWGPFITKDSSSWGGDYHLNYNYQAPYWASYSSNHIDQTDNFDQPLLDYMKEGKKHAKDLLGMQGIYYPVGIGPKGLCTTRWPLTPEEMEKRYATYDNTIDGGYKFLGQKINAVFGAANMLMRFYSTYDSAYALRIYPYLLECADFWENYLKFENGRYVIYMDHFNEVMPDKKNNGQWRNRLGDLNSTLSLGLVKMLFKGIIEVSDFLHKDSGRRQKWKYVLIHLSDFPRGKNNGRIALKSMERNWSGIPDATGLSRVSIHGLILPGGVCGPVSTPELNKILLNDITHWKDRMKGVGSWGNTLGNGIETCFPGAVRVGYNSDEILKYLRDRITAQSLSNLWIIQSGGGIETLSAVPLTINEMLMQSYEGVLRIFADWDKNKDAGFDNLRAYGAFLVSSNLKNGHIEYVKIQSEQGRPCVMENPWPGKAVELLRNGKQAEKFAGSRFTFKTAKKELIKVIPIKSL
jgi:alpha-L-fucosidase 2